MPRVYAMRTAAREEQVKFGAHLEKGVQDVDEREFPGPCLFFIFFLSYRSKPRSISFGNVTTVKVFFWVALSVMLMKKDTWVAT